MCYAACMMLEAIVLQYVCMYKYKYLSAGFYRLSIAVAKKVFQIPPSVTVDVLIVVVLA